MSKKLTSTNLLRLKQTYEKVQRIEEDLRVRTRALFHQGHRYSFYIKSERAHVTGRVVRHPKGEPTAIELAVEYLNDKAIPDATIILHPATEDVVVLAYGGDANVYTPYNQSIMGTLNYAHRGQYPIQGELDFSRLEHTGNLQAVPEGA